MRRYLIEEKSNGRDWRPLLVVEARTIQDAARSAVGLFSSGNLMRVGALVSEPISYVVQRDGSFKVFGDDP
jgi:hypothetical protein